MNTQSFNPDYHPKVFISYSWDSPEHKDRILELANRLRKEGVDCEIDQYYQHTQLSEGWNRWMSNQLKNANFVLVVCTQSYYQGFRAEDYDGRGVPWEGAIITQQLYDDKTYNHKYIPVLFTESGKFDYIPEPLRSSSYYELDKQYEDLYRHLTNQPGTLKPELGKLQSLPPRKRNPDFDKQTQNSEPQNHPVSEVGADSTGKTESTTNTEQSSPTDKRRKKVFIFTILSVVIIVILLVIILQVLHYPASENKITDFQFTTKPKTEIIPISNPMYRNLENLLKMGKFEEADQATFNLMRSIANLKNNERNLYGKKDILNFDCKALRTIDMLWTVNSNNNFGFSIQSQIWIEEGGKLGNYDDAETSDNFVTRVGWNTKELIYPKIVRYSCRVNEEKKGNLPCQVNLHIFKVGVPYIVERLKSCGY